MFEQIIIEYTRLKNEYFEVFKIDEDRAKVLAAEIEELHNKIQEELASNKLLSIKDKKARRELKKIQEGEDSLFEFYKISIIGKLIMI
jgi:regulator of replication initiation timing